jgi:ABC-2 type transport system ATP-binding protein
VIVPDTSLPRGADGAPLAILAEGLTRDFGAVRAVDGVDLAIPAGQVFGFLGPNGAGKTTTIRLLLGLLEPTAGRARVLGFDTVQEAEEIRRRSGALLEHPGLYERLSAEDNLEFYGRAWRLPSADRKARARELLERFGLYERRKESAGSWSRGMKQKLAIARAVLHRPPLVFLDEPTAGLDPAASAALRQDLAALAEREGTTIFLTTHNLAEAERLCAQIGVIRKGRLVALGHPDALRRRAAGLRVEVRASGLTTELAGDVARFPGVATAMLDGGALLVDLAHHDVSMAPIVAELVQRGAGVEEVRRHQATLEDVYLELMREEA